MSQAEWEEYARKLNRKLERIEAEHAEMAALLERAAEGDVMRLDAARLLARIQGEAP